MPQPTLFEEVLLIDAYRATRTKGGMNGRGARQNLDDFRATKQLGGAVLAELVVTGHIRVELANADGSRRFHPYKDAMVVADPTLHGDPEADAVLADITQHSRRLIFLVEWAADKDSEQYHDQSTLRTRLLRRLVQEGTLRVNHTKTLGLFPATYYPIVDDSVPTDALARLDRVLHGENPDPRTAALAVLLAPPHERTPGLSPEAFPGASATERRGVYERLRDGDWSTKAQVQAIHAISVASRTF
jgi:hypothetical protein